METIENNPPDELRFGDGADDLFDTDYDVFGDEEDDLFPSF